MTWNIFWNILWNTLWNTCLNAAYTTTQNNKYTKNKTGQGRGSQHVATQPWELQSSPEELRRKGCDTDSNSYPDSNASEHRLSLGRQMSTVGRPTGIAL